MPALMYVIGETVTGNLGTIGLLPMVLNLAIYYLLYSGVWIKFPKKKETEEAHDRRSL